MSAEAPVYIYEPQKFTPNATINVELSPDAYTPPDFNDEIEEVNYHTSRFCGRLGFSRESLVTNNMNPVLDYVHWLRFSRKNPKPEQITKYINYQIHGQIQTGLRERNHAGKSAFRYYIKGGKIYNDRFDEPFEDVLNRGLEWSKNNNSPEPERDEADIRGWKNAITFLTDKPIGSKSIQITGQGIVERTTHGDNFVDIYEKITDPEHDWIIRTIRFSSGLGYPQYKEIALKKEGANYFTGFKGPIDAWFAEHILKGDSREVNRIFEEDFGFSKGIMEEDKFEQIFKKVLPVAENYAHVLRNSHDPYKIMEAFQAMLVVNDMAVAEKNQKEQGIFFGTNGMFGSTNTFSRDDIYHSTRVQEYVPWLARQRVATISAGCGLSAGYNIFGEVSSSFTNSFIDYLGLSNNVGRFGVIAKKEGECKKITCKGCGWQPGDHDHKEYQECPVCRWAPGKEVEKPK